MPKKRFKEYCIFLLFFSTPYIRYFVAHILEYSFYKTLCLEAEQYDPLDPTKYILHFSWLICGETAWTVEQAPLQVRLLRRASGGRSREGHAVSQLLILNIISNLRRSSQDHSACRVRVPLFLRN